MIHIISEPNPGSLLLLQRQDFMLLGLSTRSIETELGLTFAETPCKHVDTNKRHSRTNYSHSLQLQFYNLQAAWYLYNAF